ncbi:MAG: DNA polymerase-3 subunit epsilon [Saprospiraceae bacterium]|jgi:DNA polymerase-3 subunit epsilon
MADEDKTRYLVLDTETTGLEPKQGHKLIEIGCVELVERRLTGSTFQKYLNPEREIDEGAANIHGYTYNDLKDKQVFADVVNEFLDYINGATLIIHNAAFDVGFIDHELGLLEGDYGTVSDYCEVLDTLVVARKLHPGQRNSLDALCQRYGVENGHRTLHGALLDSEILADVYLLMTGGQLNLLGEKDQQSEEGQMDHVHKFDINRAPLKVALPTVEELTEHAKWLQLLSEETEQDIQW